MAVLAFHAVPAWAESALDDCVDTVKSDDKIKTCTVAIDIDPNFAEAYFFRAVVYRDMEQHDNATRDLRGAHDLAPAHAAGGSAFAPDTRKALAFWSWCESEMICAGSG